MRSNILILSAVLSFILLSCESKDKWINQHDSQADTGDTAKICKQVEVECGKKWVNYDGADLEIDCGKCTDGEKCKNNHCEKTDSSSNNPDQTDTEQGNENSDTEPDNGDSSDTTPDNGDPIDSEPDNEDSEEEKCKNAGGTWNGTECERHLSLGNICTGLSHCYDNEKKITCPSSGEDFYGQDAQYAAQGKCTPRNFNIKTISGDSILEDLNTGLQWQQTVDYSNIDNYTGEEALSYCENLKYGGYSDWRVPAPHELMTILGFKDQYVELLDEVSLLEDSEDFDYYFPRKTGELGLGALWSSAPNLAREEDSFWWYAGVSGSFYGVANTNDKDILSNRGFASVLCVRGTKLPTGYFHSKSENGDIIITDRTTGLIWQKTYASDKTWKEALSYCENLTYAGYSDWRLPNKNELASLINYEKYSPASEFPGDMPSDNEYSYFCSSSSFGAILGGSIYRVNFVKGDIATSNKTNSSYVRCVR